MRKQRLDAQTLPEPEKACIAATAHLSASRLLSAGQGLEPALVAQQICSYTHQTGLDGLPALASFSLLELTEAEVMHSAPWETISK